MKITIEEPQEGAEEEVIIRCHALSPQVMQLLAELKEPRTLAALQGQEIHKLLPQNVLYCEVVNNHTFLYTYDAMYESKQRLYELEELLGHVFVRISKSVLVNLLHIGFLRPAINGRFEAVLENGEAVVVSRQYVPALKERLGV